MLPPNELFGADTVLPRLRSDLVISPQKYRGTTSFVVKDPIALRYYRLGSYELHVAGLLDGKRTLAQVMEVLQRQFPDRAADTQTVMRVLTYFAQLSFLQLSGDHAQRVFSQLLASRHKQKRRQALFSLAGALVYFKVSLFDPDLLLLKLEKRLRFLWSRYTVAALGCLAAVALGLVFQNADQLHARLPDFLTLHNLIWLWVTLVGVKIVHEFAHGLMCKHYGAEVHDMGAMFIILTPFLFCDATDSWMFRNKWHKIAVNMAGILAELVLASLAVMVWVLTPAGLVNQLAFNVMVVCSISTLVFNANPLMKFDGYYVLADLLEIPNLRDRARQQVTGFFTSLFTGRPAAVMSEPSRFRRVAFAFYSVASYFYIWYIMVRIFGSLGRRLEPYGLAGVGRASLVITYAAGILIPVWVLMKQLIPMLRSGFSGFVPGRAVKLTGGAVVACLLLAVWPCRLQVTSSCVLDGGNRVAVRAKSSGFVRRVLIKEGDLVRKDQVVAVLENPDLQDQFKDVGSRLQILDLLRQRATARNDSPALKQLDADNSQLVAAQNKLQLELGALELKAPAPGVVVTADLDLKKGTFLREGDLLCEVIPPQQVRIVIPLSEGEAGLVRTGQPVNLRMYAFPGRVFRGSVTKTFQAGSAHLPHAALAARFGGDIPTEIDQTSTERPVDNLYQAELQIENVEHLLRAGMSGRARVECGRTTPARIISSRLKNILRLDFRV